MSLLARAWGWWTDVQTGSANPPLNRAEIGGGPLLIAGGQSAIPDGLGGRVLRAGATGPDVAWLRARLGLPAGETMDEALVGAVTAWQSGNGLVGDGVVGPRTWAALGVARPAAPAVFTPPGTAKLDAGRLSRLTGALAAEGVADAPGWAAVALPILEANRIAMGERAAAFLANVLHESGRLSRLVESLDYSVEALLGGFGRHRISEADARRLGRLEERRGGRVLVLRPADQPAIAECLYGGEWGRRELGNRDPGDGWTLRGRGPLQLTGRTNYERVGRVIGASVPDMVEGLGQRASGMRMCAMWWQMAGLNELADTGSVLMVRRRVNGGTKGLAEVEQHYARLLPMLRG